MFCRYLLFSNVQLLYTVPHRFPLSNQNFFGAFSSNFSNTALLCVCQCAQTRDANSKCGRSYF